MTRPEDYFTHTVEDAARYEREHSVEDDSPDPPDVADLEPVLPVGRRTPEGWTLRTDL